MVYVFYYPHLSLHNILQLMCREFGLEAAPYDFAQMTHALHQALLAEHARGRQVVLVIDEAHTIPLAALDILVRLTTLSTVTGEPLLQMVLAGLPALWQHCHAPPLRPCTQRKVTRVTLAPLTYPESVAYIRHRLQQAGAGDSPVFAEGAVRHVARQARGNPRVMNVLCTNMLITGLQARQKPIAAPLARNVSTAYGATRSHPRWWWGVTATASILAVAGMVGLFPSTSQRVTERGPRGLIQLTRNLLTGSGVETVQHPAEMVSSPSVPARSAPPTPTEAASPTHAPTERPTPAVQVAGLPETPPSDTPPPTSSATASVPQIGAQDMGLSLETATSETPPVVSKQPVALQATPEVVMPSKTAQSAERSRTSQSRTGTSHEAGILTSPPTPPASSPRAAKAPAVPAPRMEEGWDGKAGSGAGPDIPLYQPSPVARKGDKQPDPRRSTAARAPHMAALSEMPRSAEPSMPATRASRLSERALLPPAPANPEGRARPGMPEPPAALHASPTPAAPAQTAPVPGPLHAGQDQAGPVVAPPVEALGALPAQDRGTTQDSAHRVGPAGPTPRPGVRLPEGTPRLVVEAGGHTAVIRKLLFAADGRDLVSVSDDKTIRVWSVAPDGRRARLARTIRGAIGDGRAGMLAAAALSPPDAAGQQHWLAVGGILAGAADERYAIRLHDYATGEVRGLLYGHHDAVLALAFAPTGRWLASAGKDGTIRLWDLAAFPSAAPPPTSLVLTGHTDHIYDLAWSATGDRLASASYDRTVGLWNTAQLAQGQVTSVARLRGHEDQVQTVAFHPSGTVVASGGKDHTIRLWQASDGAALGVLVRAQHKISALSFAPDGHVVLAGNFSPPQPDRLTLFAYPSGQTDQVFTGHRNLVVATAFHPSGQWVATGGGDHKEILLWQVHTGEVLSRLEGPGRTISAVGFSPDGRSLSWGQTGDALAPNRPGPLEHRFDLAQLARLPGGPADRSSVRALERIGTLALSVEQGGAYGHNARLLVHDGTRRLSTMERGQTDGYRHSAYTLTPDGHGVLSGGMHGVFQLYALDGTLRADLVGHTGEIKAVTVSADGRWAVSGANDQTLCLWALPEVLPTSRVTLTPTLSLFPTIDGEWVAWTPEGYFAASPHGARFIGYSINQAIDKSAIYVSGEQLREHFYRPEVIQQRLHREPESQSQHTAYLHTDKE